MKTDLKKIIFVDRDGTIIFEPNDFQVDALEKINFVPDVIASLFQLRQKGYSLVMVTNQDGLGTDSFPEENFIESQKFIEKLLNSQGVMFDEVLICPHFEKDGCDCRKPLTGMVTKFLVNTNIDKERSYVIGDRDTDMQFAKNLGIEGFQIDPYKECQWTDITTKILNVDRRSSVIRETKETKIKTTVDLEKSEPVSINTGINFFDHMLEQLAKHSNVSMIIDCDGDLEVDEHHTVEDVAITLGQSIKESLGNKYGINRYGFTLPMDESLASVAIDLSGRPYFVFDGDFDREKVGGLPTELVSHFFRSLSQSIGANIHLSVKGQDNHHMIEACFKVFGRALGQAIRVSGTDLPSTKGIL